MSQIYEWEMEFRKLYDRTASRMVSGERSVEKLFGDADRVFLSSIGSKPIELFDAVDDATRNGWPSFEDMLEIHRMRYEYFTKVQNGVFPELIAEYRAKPDALGGISWLPRAIDKVRAKLRGALMDDFFYPCAGDRKFLARIGMTAPQFFQLVRDEDSDDAVLRKVQENLARKS